MWFPATLFMEFDAFYELGGIYCKIYCMSFTIAGETWLIKPTDCFSVSL